MTLSPTARESQYPWNPPVQSSAWFLLAVGASFRWGSQTRQLFDFGRLVGCVRWQVQECRTWCLLTGFSHSVQFTSKVRQFAQPPTRFEE